MITVTGGVYQETCIEPLWNEIFGSSGRAAAAIAHNFPVTLQTYQAPALQAGLQNLSAGFGVQIAGPTGAPAISFDYMHSLSTPRISPRPDAIARQAPLHVTADKVLRFGMLEGTAIVTADQAVYDPQSAFGPEPFAANGSTARRLALILNKSEARALAGVDDLSAAIDVLKKREGAEVVIIKMGSHGALVATADGEQHVPAYQTDRVFKIGSGDMFSAAFAQHWAIEGGDPAAAADFASRVAAYYVESRDTRIPSPDELADRKPLAQSRSEHPKIYIASPFFDIGQRWVVEEIRTQLLASGVAVFSPLHDVGSGDGIHVAPLDLAGLDSSTAVLAVLNGADVGTVFEVGYAVARNIPVVALAQNMRAEDLKMVEGSRCDVVGDLVTAIYRAVWAA